jgi:hypothetical protein
MSARRVCLLVTLACLVTAAAASGGYAGSYQGVTPIPFAGAQSDRGIAVNKNPGSPYYGYFYGVDSGGTYDAGVIPGTGEQAVRIIAPNPPSAGTSATSYTDTGATLRYASNPSGATLMNVFVGEDDTVWVADFGTRNILTGPPGGGQFTIQFQSTQPPRGLAVQGKLGEAGTRVFVACYGTSAAQASCEVWEYTGSSWVLAASLGSLGLVRPFGVTVDDEGNSYWVSSSSSPPFVKKVTSYLFEDPSWTFTKPAFMGTSWTPGGIAYVKDPQDPQNPEYLYVSAFFTTSVMRFTMDGQYIDGYGNTNGYAAGQQPPAGTWTVFTFSGPGGNNTVWMTADDDRNTYVLVRYPGVLPQAYKVHLQGVPAPPSELEVSNDVYGQIRLKWTPPAPSTDSPTGYNIYRGTSPGSLTLYATTDDYPRWKDAAQGTTPGGPFYYAVKSFNGAGESVASPVAGPISVASSTAPAPGSKGVALSYSEVNAADTTNNPGYAGSWAAARRFLEDRGVAFDVVYDAQAGPSGLTIEEDSIAGYKLLILAVNRNMSSYTAQCIRDYVKYSQGKVLSSYYNSIANHKGQRGSNYRLADVYRVNALNVGQGGSPFDSSTDKYRYLRRIAGAPEGSALFAGLSGGPGEFNGARQVGQICYLVAPFADGTASAVGEWFNADGFNPSRPADENTSLIVGYRSSARTAVQSVMLGTYWFAQSTANIAENGGPGTLSADRLLENILGFLGVTLQPAPALSETLGAVKSKPNQSGAVVRGVVVSRTLTPGSPGIIYVQQPDRSSGIKVLDAPLVEEGDVLTIAGRVSTVAGERQLTAFEVVKTGTQDAPRPLYVRGTAIGGAAQDQQPGVTGGIGLNNVGLLIRTAGKLTEIGSDIFGTLYFRIDDGSGIRYGSSTVPGVKVIGFSPTANLGDTVAATGALGAELDGQAVVPVIRLRESEFGELLAP